MTTNQFQYSLARMNLSLHSINHSR